ncbi:helix-turn-helix domain-containing protein [Pyramidobacter piscolens]|uniref:helix-turn-helix domain-containing protein n=1 Tax=Pyramidobacter piscolens TaxID=638849 RepID=UPI002AB0180E|nr:DNA-binding transcriptional regulator [Pyramidobacter piscolens]
MSEILKATHENARSLYRARLIDDARMAEYDKLCLPEVPSYTPDEIKELRAGLDLTQNAFACLLNVSISTVQKWEIGNKKPVGAARKLLSVLSSKGMNALL